MALSTRYRWLLVALPAIVTTSIYLYGSGRSAQARSTALRVELEKEQSKPFDKRELQGLNVRLTLNRAAIERLRELEKASSGAQPDRLGPAGEDRSDVLRAISVALQNRGLIQIKSQRVEGSSEAALPKRTVELWRPYAERFHVPALEAWRIELRGSYPQVLSACEDLSRLPLFVLPLSISMESGAKPNPNASEAEKLSAARPGELKWVLTLCL